MRRAALAALALAASACADRAAPPPAPGPHAVDLYIHPVRDPDDPQRDPRTERSIPPDCDANRYMALLRTDRPADKRRDYAAHYCGRGPADWHL